ncbi:hypothetical protein ABPG74_019519 [Tetrahymena malaccensis]
MDIESIKGRGDYKPPTNFQNDLEQQKASNNLKQNDYQSFSNYSQFTQIESNKKQSDSKQNNKIGRKTSWLTSQSSETVSSNSSYQQTYANNSDNQSINFDGIQFSLMNTLNLFMKDNFTVYIIRGIQARNPNAGAVQIIANSTVQKIKLILNKLRFECYFFLLVGFILLLTEFIILIQSFIDEVALIIVLLAIHFLETIVIVWNSYSSQRYFLPQKSKISVGLCILLLLTVIGIIIAKSDESKSLPNRISILLLIQMIASGLLFHINHQIQLIYKVFI